MANLVDLRSDTLSKPSNEMRQAMLLAAVGDSFYDEDPSVVSLEESMAKIFGHEAALFVPSGTMSNQLAMGIWSSKGEAVIVNPSNHTVQYETGALSRIFGMQPMPVSLLRDGLSYDVQWIKDHYVPEGTLHAPSWACVSFENTHMKLGGRVHPYENLSEVRKLCQDLGLAMHLDGARIWNASIAENRPLAEYGKLFDTISVCFSKGLGAPVGSCLIGDSGSIKRAKKLRKMLGGTMRQCGMLAAAASYAVKNHLHELQKDHEACAFLASKMRNLFPDVVVENPETNICMIECGSADVAHAVMQQMLLNHNVKLGALGPKTLRAVLYRDVSEAVLSAF
jgi:threonine aldolase